MERKAGDRTKQGRGGQADGTYRSVRPFKKVRLTDLPIPPVVPNTRISVDYQSRDAKLLETCSRSETTLPST